MSRSISPVHKLIYSCQILIDSNFFKISTSDWCWWSVFNFSLKFQYFDQFHILHWNFNQIDWFLNLPRNFTWTFWSKIWVQNVKLIKGPYADSNESPYLLIQNFSFQFFVVFGDKIKKCYTRKKLLMYFHNSFIPRGAYFLLPLESKQEATWGWNFTKYLSEVKVNQLKAKNMHVKMGISIFSYWNLSEKK